LSLAKQDWLSWFQGWQAVNSILFALIELQAKP